MDEYYVIPILEGTDYRIHTDDHPFCDDMSCPCHEDPENVETLGQAYADGLASTGDADRIYRGKTL
jgi:hypothetical protein